jgi:hypothetical protein
MGVLRQYVNYQTTKAAVYDAIHHDEQVVANRLFVGKLVSPGIDAYEKTLLEGTALTHREVWSKVDTAKWDEQLSKMAIQYVASRWIVAGAFFFISLFTMSSLVPSSRDGSIWLIAFVGAALAWFLNRLIWLKLQTGSINREFNSNGWDVERILKELPGEIELKRSNSTDEESVKTMLKSYDDQVDNAKKFGLPEPQMSDELKAIISNQVRTRSVTGQNSNNASFVPTTKQLLVAAAELVIDSQFGSATMIQRKLRIDSATSVRLASQLANLGILGEAKGSLARDVLVGTEQKHVFINQIKATTDAALEEMNKD